MSGRTNSKANAPRTKTKKKKTVRKNINRAPRVQSPNIGAINSAGMWGGV
jgi:hypothetical protein